MSRQLPVGQVRLTNVAIVRLKRGGKRFEIACYRNKVVNWRNKAETDLGEVLQIERVFTNVSKGVGAKDKDLEKAFGTKDTRECCIQILDRGQLQVSDKEREVHMESVFKDICAIIASKCVNSETNRPFPVTVIARALKEAHFGVHPSRPAKQQALEAISTLQERIPIARARMRLRLAAPAARAAELASRLRAECEAVIEAGGEAPEGAMADAAAGAESTQHLTVVIDPSQFRAVGRLLGEVGGDPNGVEVVTRAITAAAAGGAAAAAAAAPAPDRARGSARIVASEDGGDSFGGGIPVGPALGGGSAAAAAAAAGPVGLGVAAMAAPRRLVAQPGERRMACNTCKVEFASREEHRAHYRSTLHRFNTKRKLRGLAPLEESDLAAMPPADVEAFLHSEDDNSARA